MQFEVRTLAPDLSIANLVVDALDEADARRQVEARGLFVSADRAGARGAPGAVRAAPDLSLVLFSQELLALLTRAWASSKALEALLEKEANPATRSVLERLLAGLREGKRFSAVLAEQAGAVPAAVYRHRPGRRRHQRPAARAVALHRLPAAHRHRAQQDRQRRHLSGDPAGGGRRRQRLPDRLCGAALRRGLPGRGAQPAVDVAAAARLGPVRRRTTARCCWPALRAGRRWLSLACASCCAAAAWRACWRACPASASACASMNCRACT